MNETDLKAKGYEYDDDQEWWARTWSTNGGAEKVQQVAAFMGQGEWRQLMIGDGGEIFYEKRMNEKYGVPIERPISAEHHGGDLS